MAYGNTSAETITAMTIHAKNYLAIGILITVLVLTLAFLLFISVIVSCGCTVLIPQTATSIQATNAAVETAISNTIGAKMRTSNAQAILTTLAEIERSMGTRATVAKTP
jgi:hypothetical protein